MSENNHPSPAAMPDSSDPFGLDKVPVPDPVPEATVSPAGAGAAFNFARVEEDPAQTPAPAAKAAKDDGTIPVDPRNPFEAIPNSMASGEPCNATISRNMVTDQETPAVESMNMPSADVQQNKDLLARFPNMTKMASADDQQWLETFIDGIRLISANRQYKGSLEREGSDWQQGLMDNGDVVRSQIPKFPRPEGQALSGSNAVRHAVAYLGLGDMFTAAMWNSGFWVTFTPAPEVAWLELNRLLGSEEVRLGRATYGLAHSGMTALAQETIVQYISQFVYATSVKSNEMPVADIFKYLSVHDVNNFIWGFICANYPHGFNIERSCIVDPTVCRAVNQQTLEMTELQVVDNSAIIDTALRAHMRKRQQGSVPLQQVIEYQERLAVNTPQLVEIKTGSQKPLFMKLKPPSAEQAFAMSHAHVDMVVKAVQRTVTSDTSVRERHMNLNDYFTATEMCIYQHWVESVTFNENIVEGEDDIRNLLGTFTKDAVMRSSYLDAVTAYIDKSVASIIGLEPLVCKQCGKTHSRESKHNPEFKDVIPFDVTHVFSLLAEFKAQVVRARSVQ